MLLITLNQWLWFGPSHEAMHRRAMGESVQEVQEELVTFATRLPQRKALERIMAYQSAYNEHYSKVTAVNFKIITIAKVPDIPNDLLDGFQNQLIEDLTIDGEEF